MHSRCSINHGLYRVDYVHIQRITQMEKGETITHTLVFLSSLPPSFLYPPLPRSLPLSLPTVASLHESFRAQVPDIPMQSRQLSIESRYKYDEGHVMQVNGSSTGKISSRQNREFIVRDFYSRVNSRSADDDLFTRSLRESNEIKVPHLFYK